MDNNIESVLICDSSWFLGLVVVSGVLGAIGTQIAFLMMWYVKELIVAQKKGRAVRESAGSDVHGENNKEGLSDFIFTGVLTGIVERFFFTLAIGLLGTSGVVQAAIAWVAIKGQVHYRIFTDDKSGDTDGSGLLRAYLGMFGSLVSISFAIWGGVIWQDCHTLSGSTNFCREFFSSLFQLF
ncbi:hypothetical protein NJF44_18470 [Pseudomonas guariconensis]|uniref:hypothetical protein n=1 Tax=Pseudomonas TaxID=286 RepID=UPI001CE40A55|nr:MULTISPECIES: hypothetical protein [Pseudomonas]MCO7642005.1 hypothetical protein [Pseudomonas sp. S 311-6]MCO7516806.1 hypothetical protein [Pseudomonas putida]MCO7567018.1 hypothetical protein [Pseudomonas mosselii]MCO7597100.1 hypothetical protein [Pseudomonas guariconensis]MCO7607219.1 hypothetical protein [Pseudomonas guariconensis]